MIQGDEPMIFPEMINAATQPLVDNPDIQVSNLISCIENEKEWLDPNEVKVVFNSNGFAMYFSREPIPSNKKYNYNIKAYKQVCIIPFQRKCLFDYSKMQPTPLEIIESIDMNRFLENGINGKVIKDSHLTYAVDTKDDLLNVENKMKDDKLLKKYITTSFGEIIEKPFDILKKRS